MSLAEATLRHVLRRKWKLTLVVLLFGVGLVALTHVYDLRGIIDDLNAASEAARDPEWIPEDPEAFSRGTLYLGLFGAMSFFFFLGAALVGFLMPGGMVANERRSAAIMLWAQHPMPLSRFYLRRYLWLQVGNLTAQALFATVAVFAVFPPNVVPPTDLALFVRMCLVGTLACAISYAVSANGLRRAALWALAYFFLSSIAGEFGQQAAFGAEIPRTLAVILDVLPFVIFPTGPIEEFVAGFGSGADWDWGATGLVAYHFALWTAIAWLGLRRIEGRPLKL